MTKQELEQWMADHLKQHLITNDGKCASPGKFECEPWETLYFYEMMLDGDGEEIDFADGDVITFFQPDAEEKLFFDLKEKFFAISESEQGFVYGKEKSLEEYEKILSEHIDEITADEI